MYKIRYRRYGEPNWRELEQTYDDHEDVVSALYQLSEMDKETGRSGEWEYSVMKM